MNLDIIEAMQAEYKLLKTEIHRMKESAQYFTCRGYVTIDKRLCEAIALAETAAKEKRFKLLEEICDLEQQIHVDAITYDAENER